MLEIYENYQYMVTFNVKKRVCCLFSQKDTDVSPDVTFCGNNTIWKIKIVHLGYV